MRKVLIAIGLVFALCVGYVVAFPIDSLYVSHTCPYCRSGAEVEPRILKANPPAEQWFCRDCDAGWPK